MKILLVVLGLIFSSNITLADQCTDVARVGIEDRYPNWFYAGNRRIREVQQASCEAKISLGKRKYFYCDVLASSEAGAHSVHFVALLGADCGSVFTSWIAD